jgi:aspartate carbamoyltransferase catalytic subunit
MSDIKDIVDITDLSRRELEHLFEVADQIESHSVDVSHSLDGKMMALAFFEPSTRTRLSFESAMNRLGGRVMTFLESAMTSAAKGENFADTVRMLDFYSDIIVIRHSVEGASRFASDVCTSPVINAGEGTMYHPTQTMIDLYEVLKSFGKIDGLKYAVVGDLRHARVASSLLRGLSLFRPDVIHLVSPERLRATEETKLSLSSAKVRFEEETSLDGVIEKVDVIYLTRIQKERFGDLLEYERVKGSYTFGEDSVQKMKKQSIVLHALPRVDELSPAVDKYPQARYFEQAKRGVFVRMALLNIILG